MLNISTLPEYELFTSGWGNNIYTLWEIKQSIICHRASDPGRARAVTRLEPPESL